jgi:hypothetical protein
LGLNIQASGDGAGQKNGLNCSVYGAAGDKYAGLFYANTSDKASNAQTQASTANASSEGTGPVYGIFCQVSGTGAGDKYAIYSQALPSGASPSGDKRFAGFFVGDVTVQGTLSKTAGSFLIDHPLDPYNQTLRHSFVESPEELCLYRGKVSLDTTGKAVVEMPHYFAELTHEEEATVILTCIGMDPFMASYEWNHEFKAFTAYGQPHGQLSYFVMANRDDPAIRILRRPIEENKPEHQLGTLMCPEAYGQPAPAPDIDRAVALRSVPSEFTAPDAAFMPQDLGRSAEGSEAQPPMANFSPERLETEIREREVELKRQLEAHAQVERARLEKQQRPATNGEVTP